MAPKKRCERAFGVLRPHGVNPLDIYHQRVARLDSIHKHRTAYRIGPTDLQGRKRRLGRTWPSARLSEEIPPVVVGLDHKLFARVDDKLGLRASPATAAQVATLRKTTDSTSDQVVIRKMGQSACGSRSTFRTRRPQRFECEYRWFVTLVHNASS